MAAARKRAPAQALPKAGTAVSDINNPRGAAEARPNGRRAEARARAGPRSGNSRERNQTKRTAKASYVVLLNEAFILLLEARQASAAVDQVLTAAGPCRMGAGINVEFELIPL